MSFGTSAAKSTFSSTYLTPLPNVKDFTRNPVNASVPIVLTLSGTTSPSIVSQADSIVYHC